MAYALFVIAGLNVIGVFASIAKAGTPREPSTGTAVATTALLSAVCITVEVLAGLALLHR